MSGTVQSLIQGHNISKIVEAMPRTIEKAVEVGQPIVMVKKLVSEKDIQALVEHELIRAAEMLNIDQRLNLQNHQIPTIAQGIIESFPNESLEDIVLCLRRGVMGRYDEKLLRLDGAMITQWMYKYLEEKYNVVEARLMSEKDNFYAVKKSDKPEDQPNPDRNLLSLLKTVIGPLPETETNNAKENEYQREKIRYSPPTDDDVRTKELHIQWIRENYDPITSKPKPNWIPEQQFLDQLKDTQQHAE
jgi:hypothetical protein